MFCRAPCSHVHSRLSTLVFPTALYSALAETPLCFSSVWEFQRCGSEKECAGERKKEAVVMLVMQVVVVVVVGVVVRLKVYEVVIITVAMKVVIVQW